MFRRIIGTCFLLWAPTAVAFPSITAEFKAVGGEQAHLKTVEDAIERAAKQFNFLVRGLARSRLKETNPVYGLIALDYRSPPVLRMSSGKATLELSGTHLEAFPFLTPNGESVTVDQTIEESRIHRVFHTKTGQRAVTYELDESQTHLKLSVSVSSQYMKEDLTYELLYEQHMQ